MNGGRSRPFTLQRGVCQGDPLSSLLFNIALAPLAIGIRGHPYIKGIGSGVLKHMWPFMRTTSLSVLTDPQISIPVLLEYINAFGNISGYTINWGKSEFITLTDQLSDNFLTNLPFRMLKKRFTYLGLQLIKNPRHLFKFNFAESTENFKTNIAA